MICPMLNGNILRHSESHPPQDEEGEHQHSETCKGTQLMVAFRRSDTADTHGGGSAIPVAQPRIRLSRYTESQCWFSFAPMELRRDTNPTRIVEYKGLEDDLVIRTLWCAVIDQAWEDLKLAEKKLKCPSRNAENTLHYEDAIRFFKSQDFKTICECLNIEPEPIITKALS